MVGIYDAKPAETWCGQNVVGMRYHAAEVNTVIRQVRADAEGARYFDATLVLEFGHDCGRIRIGLISDQVTPHITN